MMPRQGTIQAAFNQALAGSRHRIDTGFQRGGDLAVAPSLAGIRGIGFQQDAGFQELPRGVPDLPIIADNWSRSASLSVTTYFLTAINFLATNRLLGWVAASSQRLTAESRTWTTSGSLASQYAIMLFCGVRSADDVPTPERSITPAAG